MADTWTFNTGTDTFRLSLDGSGTGEKSRSKTFGSGDGLAADSQYTFYLDYTTESTAVAPFFEIDGGERDTGTATSGTLRVTGITDGSANITLRFGVEDAGAAPSAGASDAMAYANQAAAELAGWTITNDTPNGTISYDNPGPVGAFTHCIGMARSGPGSGGGFMQFLKEFTLTGSASYNGSLWVNPDGTGFEELAMRIENSDNTSARTLHAGGTKPTGQFFTAGNMTTKPDGIVRVRIQLTTGFGSPHADKYLWAGLQLNQVGGAVATDVDFTGITYCSGTGLSQDPGTGLGGDDGTDDPGNEPIPDPPPGGYPPPPVGGARPFGIYDIPTGGFGFWNSTVKELNLNYAANQINETTANGAFNFFRFGRTQSWLVGGRFSYDAWARIVDSIADDSIVGPLLEAAIASAIAGTGGAFAAFIVDEPYHLTRYGPGGISLATVERMCLKVKSLWPTWPTLVRVAPTYPWITRKIQGCNWLWAEYLTRRGEVTEFRESNLDRVESLGFDGCVMGLHYTRFTAAETGRDITPAEIIHYGKLLVGTDRQELIPAFNGWKFGPFYQVPGAPEAVHQLRDYFASLDP